MKEYRFARVHTLTADDLLVKGRCFYRNSCEETFFTLLIESVGYTINPEDIFKVVDDYLSHWAKEATNIRWEVKEYDEDRTSLYVYYTRCGKYMGHRGGKIYGPFTHSFRNT